MISSGQLLRFRAKATTALEQAFPTKIKIDGGAEIDAARWSGSSGVDPEMAGLLPTFDVSFRVRRALIEGGVDAVKIQRTKIEEDGKTYRVERVRDARGDLAVVLECKAL